MDDDEDDKLAATAPSTTLMDAEDCISGGSVQQQLTVSALRRNLQQMSIIGLPGSPNLADPGNFNSLCPRCGQIVYPVEKIGPIKGLTYHRVCFKCIKCDRQLDLKTYFTSALELQDKQIYCHNHQPKSNKGCVDRDNLHLRGVLQAPKPSIIQQLNFPKPSLDGRSVGIAHAVQAQTLVQNTRDKLSGRHHFPALPPEISALRQQIAECQLGLEELQKREEDELYRRFAEERRLEEQKIEQEVESAYEVSVRRLNDRYKREYGAKNARELAEMIENEKKELERNLTLEKGERTKRLRMAFMEKAQNQTAALVARQSEEMLELIRTKEKEVLRAIGEEDERSGMLKVHVESHKRRTAPNPFPPIRRKQNLYTDISVIEHVDVQAIEVAQCEQSSYTELVSALTRDLLSDLEKARAIFRWITVG